MLKTGLFCPHCGTELLPYHSACGWGCDAVEYVSRGFEFTDEELMTHAEQAREARHAERISR
jgi:hypothetical protein